tara:strand:- start:132 stop:386 length:255 start_codon:yes stop_codon:yes gene_type:complete
MNQIKQVSYAKDFIETFKAYFNEGRYNGDGMDCADMFRNDEWKVDECFNTCDDLIKMASHNPVFKNFVEEVIACMKYNKSMEMN